MNHYFFRRLGAVSSYQVLPATLRCHSLFSSQCWILLIYHLPIVFLTCPQASSAIVFSSMGIRSFLQQLNPNFIASAPSPLWRAVVMQSTPRYLLRGREYLIGSRASPHPLDICHLLGILFSNMASLWELYKPKGVRNLIHHCSGAAEFYTEVGWMLPLSWGGRNLIPELSKGPNAMAPFSSLSPQSLFFQVNLFNRVQQVGALGREWGIKFPEQLIALDIPGP